MQIEVGQRFEDMERTAVPRRVEVVAFDGVTVTLRNESTGRETKANVGSFWPAGTKRRSKGFRQI